MLSLALALSLAAQPADGKSVDAAMELCRPKLEKQILTKVNSIEVQASLSDRGWTVVRGSLIALIGMGEPAPGQVSTHHLIRAQYDFLCWVYGAKVQKLVVNRRQ
jgi:hypothetical protein